MADEALKSFTTLLESIPGWIADLEDTLQTAVKRQKEMLFENQPAQDEQPIDSCHDRPIPPSKSSSVRSKCLKRSGVDYAEDAKKNDVDGSPVVMQLPHMTQSDALRLAQRKRKTTSVCSDREDGSHKYRSRSMVVVYYDADTQKRFEAVVRAISFSRNSMRKAKISARMELLTERGSLDKGETSDNDDPIEIPRMLLRSARPRQRSAANNDDGLLAFDRIDGFLEKAQMMCERAAHQILRDGDCALEVRHAQDRFIDARNLGESEVSTWQTRAADAAIKTKRNEQRRTASKPVDQKKASSSSQEQLLSAKEVLLPSTMLEVDIEVDDGSDDEDGCDFIPLNHSYPQRPCLSSAGITAV